MTPEEENAFLKELLKQVCQDLVTALPGTFIYVQFALRGKGLTL